MNMENTFASGLLPMPYQKHHSQKPRPFHCSTAELLIRGAVSAAPGFHYLAASPAVKNDWKSGRAFILDCFHRCIFKLIVKCHNLLGVIDESKSIMSNKKVKKVKLSFVLNAFSLMRMMNSIQTLFGTRIYGYYIANLLAQSTILWNKYLTRML